MYEYIRENAEAGNVIAQLQQKMLDMIDKQLRETRKDGCITGEGSNRYILASLSTNALQQVKEFIASFDCGGN
jgi:hypothetical protein